MMQEAVTGDDSIAMLGVALASTLIDGIVDTVLTPNGLMAMLSGVALDEVRRTSVSHMRAELLRNSRWTIDSLSTVSLWVRTDKDEFRLVLQRNGLKWRLGNIIIPM